METRLFKFFKSLFFILLLSACSLSHNPSNKIQSLNDYKGFEKQVIFTNDFDILTSVKIGENIQQADIYIEGDGLSWVSKNKISKDPTPINPIGYNLATKQENENTVIYIARPCQYTMIDGKGRGCDNSVWTNSRFSMKVLENINQVISIYKDMYKFDEINLHGFSGGGAIAMLLPLLRKDIKTIYTYSGNLDTKAWTDYHKLSPLKGSLNPADFKKYWENINQIHYVGTKDDVIPENITKELLVDVKKAKIIEQDINHVGY
jgi:hypothetical protein